MHLLAFAKVIYSKLFDAIVFWRSDLHFNKVIDATIFHHLLVIFLEFMIFFFQLFRYFFLFSIFFNVISSFGFPVRLWFSESNSRPWFLYLSHESKVANLFRSRPKSEKLVGPKRYLKHIWHPKPRDWNTIPVPVNRVNQLHSQFPTTSDWKVLEGQKWVMEPHFDHLGTRPWHLPLVCDPSIILFLAFYNAKAQKVRLKDQEIYFLPLQRPFNVYGILNFVL